MDAVYPNEGDVNRALTHRHRRITRTEAEALARDLTTKGGLEAAGGVGPYGVTTFLEGVAQRVKRIVGSPFTLVCVAFFITTWIVVGRIANFDQPWQFPILLLLINLPQVPILVSLQVSANLVEAAEKMAKAEADLRDVRVEGSVNEMLTILADNNRMLRELLGR